MDRRLAGIPASSGLDNGPVARLTESLTLPIHWDGPTDTEAELATAMAAMSAVLTDLRMRIQQANGDARVILTIQVDIIQQNALGERIQKLVQDGRPAAWAIQEAFEAAVPAAQAHEDWYGAERVTDLLNLRDRVLAAALGRKPGSLPSGVPFVLVAVDLSLGDTILLDLRG